MQDLLCYLLNQSIYNQMSASPFNIEATSLVRFVRFSQSINLQSDECITIQCWCSLASPVNIDRSVYNQMSTSLFNIDATYVHRQLQELCPLKVCQTNIIAVSWCSIFYSSPHPEIHPMMGFPSHPIWNPYLTKQSDFKNWESACPSSLGISC